MSRPYRQESVERETKRQYIIEQLNKLGVRRAGTGRPLHHCNYEELKWLFAIERAKGE